MRETALNGPFKSTLRNFQGSAPEWSLMTLTLILTVTLSLTHLHWNSCWFPHWLTIILTLTRMLTLLPLHSHPHSVTLTHTCWYLFTPKITLTHILTFMDSKWHSCPHTLHSHTPILTMTLTFMLTLMLTLTIKKGFPGKYPREAHLYWYSYWYWHSHWCWQSHWCLHWHSFTLVFPLILTPHSH